MVLAQNFSVWGAEILPENPLVPAGGPAIPHIRRCSRAGSHLGCQNLLPESGKIIHSLKLNFGELESRHSLLQCWMHRGWLRPNVHTEKAQDIYAMLTYIFIKFLRNAYLLF